MSPEDHTQKYVNLRARHIKGNCKEKLNFTKPLCMSVNH